MTNETSLQFHGEKRNKLPTGWQTMPLGEVVDILDGRRVPVNAKERETRVGSVPYYGATGQVGWIDDCLFDEELVLLGEDGAPFLEAAKPKAYIVRGKSWVNNHAHVLRARNGLPNAYLKYYLDIVDYHDFVTGTTRLKLTQGAMRQIPVPIAPPDQQKRIVAEIEKQFSRLDEAVANLKRVKANLKRYKAAVLKGAVEGKLTEDWRKQHPDVEPASELLKRILAERRAQSESQTLLGRKKKYVEPQPLEYEKLHELPAGWVWATLNQLSVKITSGSRDWSLYYGRGESIFVLAQNVRPLIPDFSIKQVVDPPSNDPSCDRSRIRPNDLLVTIVGANTGQACVVERPPGEAYVCQSVALIRPVLSTLSAYINLWLNSKEHGQQYFAECMYGQGRPHLSFEHLMATPIALPPLGEQRRIVTEVERSLSLSVEAEGQIDANLKRADGLRQSILGKAFTGGLLNANYRSPKSGPPYSMREALV